MGNPVGTLLLFGQIAIVVVGVCVAAMIVISIIDGSSRNDDPPPDPDLPRWDRLFTGN